MKLQTGFYSHITTDNYSYLLDLTSTLTQS